MNAFYLINIDRLIYESYMFFGNLRNLVYVIYKGDRIFVYPFF